jgi:hypothetical protein
MAALEERLFAASFNADWQVVTAVIVKGKEFHFGFPKESGSLTIMIPMIGTITSRAPRVPTKSILLSKKCTKDTIGRENAPPVLTPYLLFAVQTVWIPVLWVGRRSNVEPRLRK